MDVSPKKVFSFYVELFMQRSLEVSHVMHAQCAPYPATDKMEEDLLVLFFGLGLPPPLEPA